MLIMAVPPFDSALKDTLWIMEIPPFDTCIKGKVVNLTVLSPPPPPPPPPKKKRLKGTIFIRIKHNMRIFGVIPFIKPQTDT